MEDRLPRLLARRAGGNALLLRELVRAGLDSGAISRGQNVWRLPRDWKFARPRRSGSSNGSRPAPTGTSNSPSNPEFFIGITWEWGQTEQLATFGELVDHEVTTGCFEEPIEMRASRHRRDAFYIGDHEVPSR